MSQLKNKSQIPDVSEELVTVKQKTKYLSMKTRINSMEKKKITQEANYDYRTQQCKPLT